MRGLTRGRHLGAAEPRGGGDKGPPNRSRRQSGRVYAGGRAGRQLLSGQPSGRAGEPPGLPWSHPALQLRLRRLGGRASNETARTALRSETFIEAGTQYIREGGRRVDISEGTPREGSARVLQGEISESVGSLRV